MNSENLINNLYTEMIQKIDSTDEISREIIEKLSELLENDKKELKMNDKEFDIYRDKMFRASAVGEEYGFVRGFRYAFRICVECMRK